MDKVHVWPDQSVPNNGSVVIVPRGTSLTCRVDNKGVVIVQLHSKRGHCSRDGGDFLREVVASLLRAESCPKMYT